VDSHGLDVVVAWRERFAARGGGLQVRRPGRLARHLLDTMGVARGIVAPDPAAPRLLTA
jgi:hypothetical protein